jgi:NitT/TauT family transport system substrate-binding protein
MAKATVFCEANRAACVKMFWKEYPNTKPSGDETTALAEGTAIFWASFKTKLSFPPGPREYGKFGQQVWVDFAQALYDGGRLETKSVDVEACYTNTFVPKFSALMPNRSAHKPRRSRTDRDDPRARHIG